MKKKLLLIDPDAEQARAITARLRLWGLDCEVADSFLFALTNLEWTRPDLVVARDEVIDGMSPSEFCATIKRDATLRTIPAVLIGTPGAFGANAVERFDVLLDDSDPSRLGAQLARLAEEKFEPVEEAVVLGEDADTAGAVHGPLTTLASLFDRLCADLESGRVLLQTRTDPSKAFVMLDHGHIVHAVFGGLQGSPAFKRIVDYLRRSPEDAQVRFQQLRRREVSVQPRSIGHAERQRLLQTLTRGEDIEDYATREFDALNLWREA